MAKTMVIGSVGSGGTTLSAILAHIERSNSVTVRMVTLDRSLMPEAALDATGRIRYTDKVAVAAMPRGEGEDPTLIFFKPNPEVYKNGVISPREVGKLYEKNSLKPDPRALLKANQDDPAFADIHPNACQWKDKYGNFWYAASDRWLDERGVHVFGRGYGWDDRWWFAGVPK